jgi:hypothetical protein
MLLQAMATARDGGLPLGVQARERAGDVVTIDSFTGIRAKGVF